MSGVENFQQINYRGGGGGGDDYSGVESNVLGSVIFKAFIIKRYQCRLN